MSTRELTRGQRTVLGLGIIPMIAVAGLGAAGTYDNAASEMHRQGTALGIVAAGEGATLVAALVMVGVTMLGQTAPPTARAALWLLPIAAGVMGLALADNPAEAVVYALTPLAMTASAEGVSFLARRIVVHATGIDIEAQRRNAALMRRIAYHRARAERHPRQWVRRRSALKAWRLMARVGDGDTQLGAGLVTVQRDQLTGGAEIALGEMLGTTQRDAVALPPATPSQPAAPQVEQPLQPEPASLNDHTDDALGIVAATPRNTPALPRAVPAAHQPATVVHQRIAPDLEDAIEEAMRTVAADDTVALMTVAEVAERKGVTPGTVRSWVNRGKLQPAQRDSDGRLRFHPAAVADLD